MDTNDKTTIKIGAAGAVLVGLGLVIGSQLGGSEAVDMKPTAQDRAQMAAATAADPKTQKQTVDPVKYDDVIVPLRAKDPQRVDLLSLVVESGQTTTTGVNLPLGARWTTDEVWWVGPAFLVLDSSCVDHPAEEATWCEVTLQNPNPESERAVFLPRWEQAAIPADGGVDAP